MGGDSNPHNKPCHSPGPLYEPTLPPVGKDIERNIAQGGVAEPWTVYEIENHVAESKKPLHVAINQDNDGYDAAWPSAMKRPAAPPHDLLHAKPKLHLPNVPQTFASILIPPLIFGHVAWVITYYTHFEYGRAAWFLSLPGLVPSYLAYRLRQKAVAQGKQTSWYTYGLVIFTLSFVYAAVVSELNYWYFTQPFYSLRAMRTYSDVNPAETSGMRVMDAASVGFVNDARVVTDMAMSFTTWDVYCVAPISSPAGIPTQGGKLASYDFWAVGVNCCKSGQTNFMCGEHDNILAKKGLRLVDPEQLKYYRLAVQQAEAQYGIEAKHPVFFHWVQDPDMQLARYFEQGFKNWIMAGALHFFANILALVFFVVVPASSLRVNMNSSIYRAD